jgi:hypothetical protein
MKIIAEHKYDNRKALRVRYLNSSDQKRLGVPDCDTLALCFDDGENESRWYLRPDEAVMLINLLSRGVFNSVAGYDIGLLRGSRKI